MPPVRPPETQAYYFASVFAAAGVLAALYRRERTGQGDHVDASMQETLATQEHIIRLWANEKQIAKRAGSQHGSVAPARIFPCRDGFRLSLRDAPALEIISDRLERSSSRFSTRRTGSTIFIAGPTQTSSIPR